MRNILTPMLVDIMTACLSDIKNTKSCKSGSSFSFHKVIDTMIKFQTIPHLNIRSLSDKLTCFSYIEEGS